MGILRWLFGGRRHRFDVDLENAYSAALSQVPGNDPVLGGPTVKEVVVLCKEQAAVAGIDPYRTGFGDQILRAAALGEPISTRIVEVARRDGATEADIREWWCLPDLSQRMVTWSEGTFSYAAFVANEAAGLTREQAAEKPHRMYPIHGDPRATELLRGDDRPLPNELRGRVDRYRERLGAIRVAEKVKSFTSYNALVRAEIRNSVL